MTREIAGRVVTALLLGILAVWALALRPQSLGGSVEYVVVRGDSMLPTYETGDLVIVTRSSDYHAGDVVAYRVPAGDIGAGRIVIHRIVGGDGRSGFVMRGDNNPAADPWSPVASEVVGRAWYVAPGFGRVVVFFHQPVIVAGIAAALVVALVIGRPPRPRLDVPGAPRPIAG